MIGRSHRLLDLVQGMSGFWVPNFVGLKAAGDDLLATLFELIVGVILTSVMLLLSPLLFIFFQYARFRLKKDFSRYADGTLSKMTLTQVRDLYADRDALRSLARSFDKLSSGGTVSRIYLAVVAFGLASQVDHQLKLIDRLLRTESSPISSVAGLSPISPDELWKLKSKSYEYVL